MNNNDVLRRLRYALDLSDSTLLACFREGGHELAPVRLMAMQKREEETGFELLCDARFGQFLDGFIVVRRGQRASGPVETRPTPLPMSHNRVLRALRIALELRDTELIAIMDLAGLAISKSEVSALFRREGHVNFQPCGNQFLRNFLRGLTIHYRGLEPKG